MEKTCTAYMLCYTMRVPKLELKDQFETPYRDIDYWNIYTETTKEGATPIAQAKYQLKQLLKNENLYTWNIGKLTASSEHYKTSK